MSGFQIAGVAIGIAVIGLLIILIRVLWLIYDRICDDSSSRFHAEQQWPGPAFRALLADISWDDQQKIRIAIADELVNSTSL